LKFTKDQTKEFNGYSHLGSTCTKYAWLPQADGFCRPEQMLLSELPDGFENTTPRAESLARALGMKQPVDLAPIAKAYGVTPEEAQQRMSVTLEEMAEIERNRQAKLNLPSLPDKRSTDPQRRAQKVAEEAENTPVIMRKVRERIVDPDYGEAQGDARTYLRHQYTNEDGVMFCQICQAPQPVMLNGKPSFEAVDCVRGINAHHEQNNLALCPNHAVMYLNSGISPDIVQCAILECEGQKIPLDLAGNKVELYFTKQHLGDLCAVLTALDTEEI
jgi:hypothetical protein